MAVSASNLVVGAGGLGARAAAGAFTQSRRVLSLGADILVATLEDAPGVAALDEAGRRDRERARAALDRAIDRATVAFLDSAEWERFVGRLLESEQLWRIVSVIAKSDEVIDAVSSASVGLAGEIADATRRRTTVADDFAERVARRLLRRRPPPTPPLIAQDGEAEARATP